MHLCLDRRALRAIRAARAWETRRARYGPSGRRPSTPESRRSGSRYMQLAEASKSLTDQPTPPENV